VAAAALAIALASLVASIFFAIRQERWRRRDHDLNRETRDREAADREEQLALQRYDIEHDEGGWRRWGTPPKRKDR
jgi:type VI protein secretion system component VasK